jgi:hypothetical protein
VALFLYNFQKQANRRNVMPRKNKRKTEPHRHAPSIYDRCCKPQCRGCAFAGQGFVCLTSDGKCLKAMPPDAKGVESHTDVERRTNNQSPER